MLYSKFYFASENNKIWIFSDEFVECEVVDEDEQVITCELGTPEGIQCLVSIVYAKCQHQLRLPLWDTIRGIATSYYLPWAVIGDFKCITDTVEKKGGLPHKAYKSIPF